VAPVTTTFDVADWNGGVQIADPSDGLTTYASMNNASRFLDRFFLTLDNLNTAVGQTLTSGASWTAIVDDISDGVRVRRTAGRAPVAGDPVLLGADTSILQSVTPAVVVEALGADKAALVMPGVFVEGGTIEFDLRVRGSAKTAEAGSIIVGMANDADSLYLAFGDDGIAFSPTLDGDYENLSGTGTLNGKDAAVTFRLVVDPDETTARLFATLSSQLPYTGHVFRRLIPRSSLAAGGGNDGLVVYGSGSRFELRSLRAASVAIETREQPTAVPGTDRALNINDATTLNGTDSVSPSGLPLDYYWTLVQTPVGAEVQLSGPTFAAETLQWPSTTLTFTSVSSGVFGNLLTVTLIEDALAVAVSVAYSAPNTAITFPPGATIADLQVALLAAGSAVPVDATLSGAATELLYAAVVTLRHGADGSGSRVSFMPDKLGVFRIGLVVSDGTYDSSMVVLQIDVVESTLDLGYVPDGSVAWRILRDAYTLAPDSSFPETMMSLLTQLVTQQETELWQHDDLKSIETVGRTFLRRWVPVRPLLAGDTFTPATVELFSESVDARPLAGNDGRTAPSICWTTGTLAPVVGEYLVVKPDWRAPRAYAVKTVEPLLIKSTAGGQFVIDAYDGPLLYAKPQEFLLAGTLPGHTVQVLHGGVWYTFAVGSVDEKRIIIKGDASAIPTGTVVSYAIGGRVTLEENLPLWETILDGPRDGYIDGTDLARQAGKEFESGPAAGDTVTVTYRNGTEASTTIGAPPAGNLTLPLNATVPDPGRNLLWKVERWHGGAGTNFLKVMRLPTFAADRLPKLEDLAVFVLPDADETEVRGMVVAQDTDGTIAAVYPETTADEADLFGFYQVSAAFVAIGAKEIPRLQENPRDSSEPLLRAQDYDMLLEDGDGFVTWNRAVTGTLSWDGTAYSTDVDLSLFDVVDGATITISTYEDEDYESLETAWGHGQITLGTGTAVEIDWLVAGLLDLTAPFSVPFTVRTYGAFNPPPDLLWAEEVYFDNSETIENTFGVAVGLNAEDVGVDQDYLSSVQALWYALWMGPTISNLRLGAQVFLGLPFTEEAGVIEYLDPSYSDSFGRVVVLTEGEFEETRRTYLYPAELAVETNPNTGVAYTVGDDVERFVPLCEGVEIIDHIKSSEWLARWLTGKDELRKVHTFLVEMDLTGMGSVDAGDITRLAAYINKVKPAHTDFFLVGVHTISDTIDVQDAVTMSLQHRLIAEPYTSIDLYRSYGDGGADWMPEGMYRTFHHRFDDWDDNGHITLQEWNDYSTKGRELVWLELENITGTIVAGDILYQSAHSAFQVLQAGASYVLCRRLVWSYVLTLDSVALISIGDEIYKLVEVGDKMTDPAPPAGSHTGALPGEALRRWSGWVIGKNTPASTVRVALTYGSYRSPHVAELVDLGGQEITAVEVAAFHEPPSVVPLGTPDGTKSAYVKNFHVTTDYISELSRRDLVGPEIAISGFLRFPITGDGMRLIEASGVLIEAPDWLSEDLVPPTFFMRTLNEEEI
jgi:hypothetical protein